MRMVPNLDLQKLKRIIGIIGKPVKYFWWGVVSRYHIVTGITARMRMRLVVTVIILTKLS